jgi:hypothetical protein
VLLRPAATCSLSIALALLSVNGTLMLKLVRAGLPGGCAMSEAVRRRDAAARAGHAPAPLSTPVPLRVHTAPGPAAALPSRALEKHASEGQPASCKPVAGKWVLLAVGGMHASEHAGLWTGAWLPPVRMVVPRVPPPA